MRSAVVLNNTVFRTSSRQTLDALHLSRIENVKAVKATTTYSSSGANTLDGVQETTP